MIGRALALAIGIAGLTMAAAVPPASRPSPRVVFTERFPGSQPVFFKIAVRSGGEAIYETIEATGQPALFLRFSAPELAARIFALARGLHDFQTPSLESHKRVGDMGEKTLAFENGADRTQQSFNFTTVRAAAELNQIFQGLSTASEDALRLERDARYDPLSVIEALNQIGRDWESRQISSAAPLLPVLRRTAGNPSLMRIARHRARRLLAMMARR